ncbi:MAG: c-type cytochrome [Vicinamibacteraceae bacterium]|nr:c-type cytochrome [Vicinamibacteraceae bacterium]
MRAVSRCLPLVFVGLALLWGPQAVADAGHQGLKRVRPSDGLVQSVDGKSIYDAYCANCHGTTGRGNGPAARHLSVSVPDLSTIAVRDGKFNFFHVQVHVTSERARGEACRAGATSSRGTIGMTRAAPDWRSRTW